MKKRKKNQSKLWAIGILAILLFATPTLHAYNVWGTEDIDKPITGNLFIYGTANLLTGASVEQCIYVQNGGTLNMHSGTIGHLCFINVSPSSAGMTVYGTDFAVSNGTIDPEGYWTLAEPGTFGTGTLTGIYKDKSEIDLWILSDTPVKLVDIENNDERTIEIDVKPGSDENVINLKSRGVVPVAVLTTDEFYAGDLVPDYSISFAGASPVHSTLDDVDNDGDEDMLFHFRTQELNLDETSKTATLTASLNSAVTKSSAAAAGDVTKIEGTDKVKIKSSKKK
ncbi:MAG: hypothetical protein ACYS17_06910 [Planctomycetota bacterium]|jgi:hypothetical protein